MKLRCIQRHFEAARTVARIQYAPLERNPRIFAAAHSSVAVLADMQ